ncbi:MAG TPA: hypothetical protein VFD30_16405 [Terriglobia bacterium]|nr:hypothetical protein [Terriglobia bacterium]
MKNLARALPPLYERRGHFNERTADHRAALQKRFIISLVVRL